MQTRWLNRQNNPDRILFMAGWGMGPEPFQELDFGPVDVLMVYDYRSLDTLDFSAFFPAVKNSRLHLSAWSMGVWAAALLSRRDASFAFLDFSSATAIGGTCTPVDDQFGIPVQIFDQMLADFSPAVLTEFYHSMFDRKEETERFLRCRPNRPLEEVHQELLALRKACTSISDLPDIYTRRIVTKRDRIFSFRNQVRAWGRKNCTPLALPHFPFYEWADFLPFPCCSKQGNLAKSSSLPIFELPTDQYEDRPEGALIDTLIIHSMYNPEAKDPFSAQSCKVCLDTCGVSSHYVIDLDGKTWRTVPEAKKAWHAGISTMPADGREGVNAFSIGIELVGTEDTDFREAQYQALALLTKDILSRHDIRHIYGHCDVAPGRKTDPWNLDWPRYRRDVLRFFVGTGIRFCNAALV